MSCEGLIASLQRIYEESRLTLAARGMDPTPEISETADDNKKVEPDGYEWEPVEIKARTPNTLDALLHHAHRGFACTACEIVALRATTEITDAMVERVVEVVWDLVDKTEHSWGEFQDAVRAALSETKGERNDE